MRTTNRPTLISILCTLGILLCVFCMGKAAFDFVVDYNMKEVRSYTENVTIVETFYTTDDDGYNSYYLMWENDHATDIMKVCSACYAKYRDAETMPLEIKVLDSKSTSGYNFKLHNHYNYERTDK